MLLCCWDEDVGILHVCQILQQVSLVEETKVSQLEDIKLGVTVVKEGNQPVEGIVDSGVVLIELVGKSFILIS